MNGFQNLVLKLQEFVALADDLRLGVDEPVRSSGRWVASIVTDDDYVLEIHWGRHVGFGVSAGYDLQFGSGVGEVLGSVDATFERVVELVENRASTGSAVVSLGELRKLKGVLQKEAAQRLGMSKSGLNQIESGDVSTLQLSTLKKVVESFGGELVILARFKEGNEREIAVDTDLG